VKILVTGVAGFIGSNLADRLLGAGHHVIGVDNLAYGIPRQVPAGIEFHQLDIRSRQIYDVLEGVDVVFHLAAKNDLVACQKDPVETMEINVAGTANVFEAARQAKVHKVVLATSSALEEGEARLNGFYAISKVTAERLAVGYKQAFGLPFVAVRYFNVYGPRQDYRRLNPPVISAFIIRVLKHEAPVLFDGYQNNKRDFIYVDDINDFHLQCIDDDRLNDNLFRLGTGITYSMDQVWNVVKKVTGTDLEPIIKPRAAEDTPAVTQADISAASEMGWRPKTSFEDGIRSQFEFLKAEFQAGRIR
jgi:nucleoside-diphosphate-sugar epimerase